MEGLEILQDKLQFPLTAYVKENGFLGILSYDKYKDDLLFCTKSSIGGPFAEWFKELFEKIVSEEAREAIKQYCKDNNVTMLFEVVDTIHDPHIINYPKSNLFLLDIVANNLDFNHVSYITLCNIASKFGLHVKEKAYEISDWQDFYDWYQMVTAPDYKYTDLHIEGFVVEDSNNFMFKLKTEYYNKWKRLRSIAAETLRKGYIDATGKLYDQESNYFYGFLRKLYIETDPEKREELPRDIVTLRKMYEEDLKND